MRVWTRTLVGNVASETAEEREGGKGEGVAMIGGTKCERLNEVRGRRRAKRTRDRAGEGRGLEGE